MVEYKLLTKLREELTKPSHDLKQKYFRLIESLIFSAEDDAPNTNYSYLYIRKPDDTSYGNYLGDVDFFTSPATYRKLKRSLKNGHINEGVRIYDRTGWDTIQITDAKINSVAYLSTKKFAEKVRVRFD
jgi:hypothetical protein